MKEVVIRPGSTQGAGSDGSQVFLIVLGIIALGVIAFGVKEWLDNREESDQDGEQPTPANSQV